MTINSVYIYGFGKLTDLPLKLTAGLNRVLCSDEQKKKDFAAFIIAAFCGFANDSVDDASSRSGSVPVSGQVLPSRKEMLPPDGVSFGGEISFSDNNKEYMISAKWGENSGDDIVSLVTAGGSSEILKSGETVCRKLWGLSPDEALSVLAMPSDGRDVSLLLRSLLSLPEKEAWFEREQTENPRVSDETGDKVRSALERLEIVRRQLKNDVNTGSLDMAKAHLNDLKEELAIVDRLEETASRLRTQRRDAEKEKNDLAKKAGSDQNIEQFRALSDSQRDSEQAAAIRKDMAELEEEIVDEEKYVRRGQRPWLVLLWILAVIDVVAIVILTVYPVKIPWLSKILTAIAPFRFPALYVAAGLFLLFVILIAVVSGSGMRRLNLLKGDMEFRKRQLSELLTATESFKQLDPETADIVTRWNDSEEKEFLAAADRALGVLEKKAASAKSSLSGFAGTSGAFASIRTKNVDASERLSAIEAELAACEEQLKLHRPYPVIEEKCAGLEEFIERSEMQLAAISLAENALTTSGDDPDAANDLWTPSIIARRANDILIGLSSGSLSGLRISSEMVPFIDHNGSLRGLGSVSALTADQILLSIKLAQLSLSGSGPASLALLGQALDRFDTDNAPVALSYISSVLAGSGDVQLIVDSPAAVQLSTPEAGASAGAILEL
jgi:hypothetical protein